MKALHRGVLFGLAALSSALWASAGAPAGPSAPPAAPPPSPKAIKILSDAVLPVPAYEWASDVRWASDRRVYLALGIAGTVEVNVEPAGAAPRGMVPGRDKPGGSIASYLGASSRYLVVAAPGRVLTWRPLQAPELSTFAFDAIQAVDVRENRLAVVGAQRDGARYAPDGAIAWIGSLDKQLADLKPILYDVGGPGAPTMDRCLAFSLAAARFLADGSLVVLPGVQPGVNLYDGTGKLLRTWDTASLGIDTDCSSLSYEQSRYLGAHGPDRRAWLNQRRTVDSLLPLPQGIGFVIRRVEQGQTRWNLKILRPDGSIRTYAIPIEGSNSFFHLDGDVRGQRAVFVLHETLYSSDGRNHPVPSRLILAEVPED
jgi:hypothetical protein